MATKKPGWTQVPNCLLEGVSRFTECELKIYLLIVRETTGWHRRKKDLSIPKMAGSVGMSERSVREAVGTLVERDLVTIQKQFREDGGQACNLYELAIEDDPPPAVNDTPPLRQDAPGPLQQTTGVNKEERKQEERKEQSSPTPSFEEEFLDSPTLIRKFGRFKNFRKPRKFDAEKALVTLTALMEKGLCITEAQANSSMEGYRQSAWGKENGWPIMAWANKPLSWISEEWDTPAYVRPTVPSATSMSLEVPDKLLEDYLGVFMAAGVAIGDKERDDARPLWLSLTTDQKLASGRDAVRICSNSEPRYIKSPAKHLADRPWTRVVRERILPAVGPIDKNAEARRISRQRGMM